MSVCRDPANQFGFTVEAERCHASYAIEAATGAEDPSAAATSYSAYLRH